MESGVLDKGDIQKVQGSGATRTGLGSTKLLHVGVLGQIINTSVFFRIEQ